MIVDAVVLSIVFISALIAFLRGFIREMLTIFGIVGAMAGAYVASPLFSPMVRSWFGVEDGQEEKELLFNAVPYSIVANVLAYVIVLIAFIVIFSIISHQIAEGARRIGLGAIDRAFGALFGLARGALVVGLLYMPFHYMLTEDMKEDYLGKSITYLYLEYLSEKMVEFMPEEMMGKLGKAGEDATKAVEAGKTDLARDALQKMDLLGTSPDDKTADPESEQKNDGYGNKFRDKMNELIEDNQENSE